MFKQQKIYISFCVLFFTFYQTLNAQKIDLKNYENKAKAYAIIAAQYNKDAYSYARENYFSVSNTTIVNNSDTALLTIQTAINFTDSAIFYSLDTCLYAIKLMKSVRYNQDVTLQAFMDIKNGNYLQKSFEISMYSMANAVVDAYTASLFIETNNFTPKPKGNRAYTRLESDESSYITIKQLYENRLTEIRNEISLLKIESQKRKGEELIKVNNAINLLKEEEEQYVRKTKNSEHKLINVKNELSAEMMQIVSDDIFATDKNGFYNSSVPIPNNIKIPQGLVYRIQIGFFANELSPEHFDGVFPISSQKIDDVYYRYEAGNFSNYTAAKIAKNSITEKGYADSFLIAYFNGKKISISEALQKEKGFN